MSGVWQKYEVQWEFKNRLCGSVPLAKDMINPWLEARKPKNKPAGERSMNEIANEVTGTLTVDEENIAIEERTTLGFQAVDGKLVMRGGTVKAHLKDCARVLSSFKDRAQGDRSFSIKFMNCVYVDEYWISILKHNKPAKESDGTFDKAVHVTTAQGPRNALKRIHYVEKPTMTFHLNVLESMHKIKTVLSIEDLKTVFEYGGMHGYAGERGDGEGRYTFSVKEVRG